MQRIALGLEYEGASFKGWQKQNSLPTVQYALEQAISKVIQSNVDVFCAGRTDAGVHGLGQVVHFDTPVERPMQAWIKGVNTHLPKSIRIKWAKVVSSDFHARYSATSRKYLYFLYSDPVSPGLLNQGVTWVYYPLNVDAMRQAAQHWVGEHDFSAFRASDCQSKSPIRHLYGFDVEQMGKLTVLAVHANAFLHHMIRNMVGTLLCIGRGFKGPEYANEVLLSRNRQMAPPMASPAGLYLYDVRYPADYDLPEVKNTPWFMQANQLTM